MVRKLTLISIFLVFAVFKTIILLGFIFLSQINFSQSVYEPVDTASAAFVSDFLNDLNVRYNEKVKKIKHSFKGKKKKLLLNIYREQHEQLIDKFKSGILYGDRSMNDYLNRIADTIIASNPTLAGQKVRLYFSRIPETNAFDIGDGIIIVDLRLLEILDTEAQLAGVISHELSHYFLHHSDKTFEKRADFLLSDKYRKKMKAIRRKRYGKYEMFQDLIKKFLYYGSHYSRKFESEADSAGLHLMTHTRYNPTEMIRAYMHLYDYENRSSDSLSISFLRKIFSVEGKTLKDAVFRAENSPKTKYQNDHTFFDKDSIKDHPDLKVRISALKRLARQWHLQDKNGKTFLADSACFRRLKKIAAYESIYNYYILKKYGKGLYQTILLWQDRPDDGFYENMFCRFVLKLYEAKNNMSLSRYIPGGSSPDDVKSKRVFINLMNKLSLEDWKNLAVSCRKRLEKIDKTK